MQSLQVVAGPLRELALVSRRHLRQHTVEALIAQLLENPERGDGFRILQHELDEYPLEEDANGQRPEIPTLQGESDGEDDREAHEDPQPLQRGSDPAQWGCTPHPITSCARGG